MRPPADVFEAIVAQYSSPVAYAMLKQRGYGVSQREVRAARKNMPPEKITGAFPIMVREPHDDRHARLGSAGLEYAICELYAKTAKRLGCKLETAALILNYTPAQIAKMQAAA